MYSLYSYIYDIWLLDNKTSHCQSQETIKIRLHQRTQRDKAILIAMQQQCQYHESQNQESQFNVCWHCVYNTSSIVCFDSGLDSYVANEKRWGCLQINIVCMLHLFLFFFMKWYVHCAPCNCETVLDLCICDESKWIRIN